MTSAPIRIRKILRPVTLCLILAITGCDLNFNSESATPDKGPVAVVFHIDGPMPQFSSDGFLGDPGMSQHRFEKLMRRAEGDILVQEIIIHFGAPQIGWARAGEIGEAITRTAKKKPVTCLLESADNLTYWMAARACPRVLIAPAGSVELVGIAAESVFIKDLLGSFGVSADVLAVGRYKSAAESITRTSMSESAREATNALLDSIHNELVSGISAGRKLSAEKVRALIDGGPYSADDALKASLVDQVQSYSMLTKLLTDKYEGGVVDDYGKEPPKPIDFTEIMKMLSNSGEEEKKNDSPHIAIIPVIGTIQSGRQQDSFIPANDGVYDITLMETLAEAAKDKSVVAVVLRIDSPGGSALASDNIWEAVHALAQKKPVVASMGDVAASGGYYIASAATAVLASKTTITGSIGVIGGKAVLRDAATKYGVQSEILTRGKNAGMLSPFAPFSDAERDVLMKHMKSMYDLFVRRIMKGRNLKKEVILAHAEGRVWSGTDALKSGLIEKEGSLESAVNLARELAKNPGVPAELFPRPRNFMEILGEQLSGQDARTQVMSSIPGGRDAMILHQLLSRESVLALSPELTTIH